MLLISHRGMYDKEIKENTYSSVTKALESSEYVGAEFDVRATLDNEFILYHDSSFNKKLVSNTLYKEMPKYVPRLEDILRIKSNKIFLIEIKNINNKYSELIKILNKHKDKKIYVTSFSNKIIRKLDSKGRTYKIGLLNYVLNTSELIKGLDFVCVLNSLINNKSIINSLKGKEIFSYGGFFNKSNLDIYYIV